MDAGERLTIQVDSAEARALGLAPASLVMVSSSSGASAQILSSDNRAGQVHYPLYVAECDRQSCGLRETLRRPSSTQRTWCCCLAQPRLRRSCSTRWSEPVDLGLRKHRVWTSARAGSRELRSRYAGHACLPGNV